MTDPITTGSLSAIGFATELSTVTEVSILSNFSLAIELFAAAGALLYLSQLLFFGTRASKTRGAERGPSEYSSLLLELKQLGDKRSLLDQHVLPR